MPLNATSVMAKESYQTTKVIKEDRDWLAGKLNGIEKILAE